MSNAHFTEEAKIIISGEVEASEGEGGEGMFSFSEARETLDMLEKEGNLFLTCV